MAMTTEFLQEIFESNSFSVENEQLLQFCKYAELLVEWNQKMNLTAITDDEGIAYKHFVDSLAPVSLLGPDFFENRSLIDVGTGAGFPGFPLKILCPQMKLTLLDSLKKRVLFLREVASQLSLDAQAFHSRAEEAGHREEFRESFDIATARAVAHLRELSEYCLPFVKVGGFFLALKAGEVEQELDEARNAIGMMGGKIDRMFSYEIEHAGKRTLIVIKKISHTSTKYPRTPAKISKTPLR